MQEHEENARSSSGFQRHNVRAMQGSGLELSQEMRMLAVQAIEFGKAAFTNINPLLALGVLASTAATDAAYVFFNAAVGARHRVRAANWSSVWYMLSAFAVISYTENPIYVVFAAIGSWAGAFASVTWLVRAPLPEPHSPP
jgi:hypothetical protein